MARSLADPLYERLMNSFPDTQAYTRADWDDDAMPDPVSHFLSQLLKHHSRREARRLRRARTDWVDYNHPNMKQAVRSFFEAVKSHTRVPADEWRDSLRRATRHATAHLIRPVHVLSDFVYADSEEALPLSKILWRMNFFGPYDYLRKAVRAFADKQNLDALGPERFDRFLHRVDERITSDYNTEQWLHLLTPLFDIARRATGREHVPTALLQAFFEEKGRLTIEQQLGRHADNNTDGVTPRTLQQLLEAAEADAVPDTPSAPTGPSSPQKRAEEQSDRNTGDTWNVGEDSQPEGTGRPDRAPNQTPDQTPNQAPDQAPSQSSDNDGSVPLWQQFQQGGGAPDSNDSSASEPPPSPNKDSEQKPLWARFQHDRSERLSDSLSDDDRPSSTSPPESQSPSSSASPSPTDSDPSSPQESSFSASPSRDDSPSPASSTPNPPSSDLAGLEQQALGTSNPPHRSVYVRELFDGDHTDYQRILRRIADADSWGEASQIIASDVFRKHKVNIYSDAAVHFTNTVEDRFRNT